MLQVGEVFAGYTVERQLGAGGMGEAYVVRHPRLPRREVLKLLAAHPADDPQLRARFEREVDRAASLSHPNIVAVHDRGDTDGRMWITRDHVDGIDLSEYVRQGPMRTGEVARVVGDMAVALDFAGAQGLIHRDVKPANIIISTTGRVLLTDVGIAALGVDNSEVTGTGMALSTINYASPEQLQGQPVDPRSDQYSLAATAFHLLTGSVPFANTNAGAVIVAHVTAPVPSAQAARPELSSRVDTAITRAMAKSPADRFPSSAAFAAELTAALAETRTAAAAAAEPTIVRGDPTAFSNLPAVPDEFDPTQLRASAQVHPNPPGPPCEFDRTQRRADAQPPFKATRQPAKSKAVAARLSGVVAAAGGATMAAGAFMPWMQSAYPSTVVQPGRPDSYIARVRGIGIPEIQAIYPGGTPYDMLWGSAWSSFGIATLWIGGIVAVIGLVTLAVPRRFIAVSGAVLATIGSVVAVAAIAKPALWDRWADHPGVSVTNSVMSGLWLVTGAAIVALVAFVTAAIVSRRGA
ncbi:serine/threonine-protein kinase [Tsukamurella ocularis]|uniref:serine/threonine-protein kinase n=1 Tax=Tsukamurella ocularis TaxID=1970234 RepID=UPI002169409D|nr:serine/threonine-protein kinase [Tsukamurella ocularis]MCS3782464.1 serine/threonine protein kinase [Tsukamurella ocularis]MCS3789984.1 serine/threonine protein kinase [Tsukamurella ocularis]MCS3853254.1 serine/threonine protein kinase [Tsukamurella ocularis]